MHLARKVISIMNFSNSFSSSLPQIGVFHNRTVSEVMGNPQQRLLLQSLIPQNLL